MSGSSTAEVIRQIITRELEPVHLELRDDSHRHVGHPGATSGGGHYRLLVVSPSFDGRSRLERHRMVYAALGDRVGREIHALALELRSPDEWEERGRS